MFYAGNLYYNDTFNFSDGVHTIRIFANDTQGYINFTEVITFTVDTLPPIIKITEVEISEVDDITEVAKVTISWTIEVSSIFVTSLQIKLDEGDWIILTVDDTKYIFNDVRLGEHEITIRVIDSTGKIIVKEHSFTVEQEKGDEMNINIFLITLFIGIAGITIGILFIIKKIKSTR